MKKLFIALILVAFAAPAFAANTSITTATILGGGKFTPSAKVGLNVTSTSLAYTATSCHVSGTFQYGTVGGSGTASDASKVYQATIPTQTSTATVCAPTAAGSTAGTLPTGTTWN